MYILHVLASPHSAMHPSDGLAISCAASIAAFGAVKHRVVALSPGGFSLRAINLGLRLHGHISGPGAERRIRHVCEAWGPPALVQLWGTTPNFLKRCPWPCIRFEQDRGEIATRLAGSSSPWESRGIASPWVQSNPAKKLDAAQGRRTIGLEETSKLLLAIGDPTAEIDGHMIAEAAGILNVSGMNITACLPRGASALNRVQRHATEGYLRRLIVSDLPLWRLLPAADIVVVAGSTPQIPFLTRLLVSEAERTGIRCVSTACIAGAGDRVIETNAPRGSAIASACLAALSSGGKAQQQAIERTGGLESSVISAWTAVLSSQWTAA